MKEDADFYFWCSHLSTMSQCSGSYTHCSKEQHNIATLTYENKRCCCLLIAVTRFASHEPSLWITGCASFATIKAGEHGQNGCCKAACFTYRHVQVCWAALLWVYRQALILKCRQCQWEPCSLNVSVMARSVLASLHMTKAALFVAALGVVVQY